MFQTPSLLKIYSAGTISTSFLQKNSTTANIFEAAVSTTLLLPLAEVENRFVLTQIYL